MLCLLYIGVAFFLFENRNLCFKLQPVDLIAIFSFARIFQDCGFEEIENILLIYLGYWDTNVLAYSQHITVLLNLFGIRATHHSYSNGKNRTDLQNPDPFHRRSRPTFRHHDSSTAVCVDMSS